MKTSSIGKRIMRETARRTINRTKNKVVTQTTRTILKQVPKSKNPLLSRLTQSLTREAVRTVTDFMVGYAGGLIKKGRQSTPFLSSAHKKSSAATTRFHKQQSTVKIKFMLAFALFLGVPNGVWATEIPPTIPIEIITPTTTVPVTVEVADEAPEWERGLMFRKELPEMSGMIFLYFGEHPISMWMKNTYIPLDMLFFNKEGVIVHIAKNRQPLDETFIPSVKPVIGVLEVNGGFADKHQINIGDKINLLPEK